MVSRRPVSPGLITVTKTVCRPEQEIDLLPQCFSPGVHNLQTNTVLVADHRYKLDVQRQHSQRAFLPVKERDLYLLGPQPTVRGDLNPTFQSLVF